MRLIKVFLVLLILFSIDLGVIRQQSFPRVVFLDVGQGDAILIQPESGYEILIDSGGGDYVVHQLGEFMLPWDREIEELVITHPHIDHFGGLFEIIQRFEVGEVIMADWCKTSVMFHELEDRLLRMNINVWQVSSDVNLSSEFDYDILWPKEKEFGEESCFDFDGNVNNDSIVVLLKINGWKILLMGDAESLVEDVLAADWNYDEIDILKVGHHCSKTSSSQKFLDTIDPRVAICSVGEENKFGHPSLMVLARLASSGIQVIQTLTDGNIVIEIDRDVLITTDKRKLLFRSSISSAN